MADSAITHRLRALLAIALTGAAAQAVAGNQWMMERNAQELIQLNEEILTGLDQLPGDGRIYLEARIVKRDGKRVITLDRVEPSAQPAEAGGEAQTIVSEPPAITPADAPVLASPGQYRTFIRYRPLTEVPDPVQPDITTE